MRTLHRFGFSRLIGCVSSLALSTVISGCVKASLIDSNFFPIPTTSPVTTVDPISIPDASRSTFRAIPASIAADGAATATVTVTLNNSSGSPLSGKSITLSSDRGGTDSIVAATTPAVTDVSGQASFTISSATSGEAVLTATESSGGTTRTWTTRVLFLSRTPTTDFQARLFDGLTNGDNSSTSKSVWKNLASALATHDGALSLFAYSSSSGWAGSGSVSSPYALAFDGTGHSASVDFGTGLNGSASFSFETWLSPSSSSTAGRVIFSNGESTNVGTASEAHSGVTLRQSSSYPGFFELQLGNAKTYAEEVLADSPMAFWRLDEVGLGVAVDFSGNHHDGTYGSFPLVRQTGALSGEESYSIKSDSFAVAGFTVNAGTTHTCEAWVNIGATTGAALDGMVVGGLQASHQYCMYLASNTIYYSSFTGFFVSMAYAFSSNTWYHIAVVRNGSSVDFYVNGQQVGATQNLGDNTASTYTNLGSYQDGTFSFNGYIDEAAIYPTDLSASRILEHYIAGTKRFGCRSSQAQADGAWKHFVGVFDSAGTPSLSLYVNGMKQCQVSLAGTAYSGSSSSLKLGSAPDSSGFWSGLVADLRTYAAAMISSDVVTHYTATQSRFMTYPNTADLALWLKADAISGVSDGGALGTWNDSSANALDAVAGVAPIYHSNGVNGLPVVSFNGTTQYLSIPYSSNALTSTFATGGEYAAFIVFKNTDFSVARPLIAADEIFNPDFYIRLNAAATVQVYGGGSDAYSTATTSTLSNASIQLFEVVDSKLNGIQYFINGSAAGTSSHLYYPSGKTQTHLDIGRWIGSLNFFQGDIAEILIYKTALTTNDRQAVEEYLRTKYALW